MYFSDSESVNRALRWWMRQKLPHPVPIASPHAETIALAPCAMRNPRKRRVRCSHQRVGSADPERERQNSDAPQLVFGPVR